MPRPRKAPVKVLCRVLIPNLWTTEGKAYQGDEISIPEDEAKWLDGLDKIKIVRQ
jgi:hypothetical protein